MVFSDESGQRFTISGYGVATGLPAEIDPRIDLTQPIYEQVMKLAVQDQERSHKSEVTAA
jgi:hypothetical protein